MMCVCNVSGIHQTKQWIVGEILKVSHSKILCLSSSNCCKWDYLIWCCNFLPPFTSQLQLMKLQPLEGHIDLKVVKLLICLGYNHLYEPSPYKQKKTQLVQLCLYYWRTNTQTYLHFFYMTTIEICYSNFIWTIVIIPFSGTQMMTGELSWEK